MEVVQKQIRNKSMDKYDAETLEPCFFFSNKEIEINWFEFFHEN